MSEAIAVALIGLLGTLGAALIGFWANRAGKKKAIGFSANSVGEYIKLTQKLVEQKDLVKAIEIANEMIKRFPNDGNSYGNLAYVYRNQGKYNKSLMYCNKAIKLNQNNRWFYNTRGLCYFYTGKLDQAEKDFQEAIYKDSSYEPAIKNLCMVQERKQTTRITSR